MPLDLVRNRLPLTLVRNRLPLDLVRNRMPLDLVRNRMPLSLVRNRLPLGLVRNRLPLDLVRNRLLHGSRIDMQTFLTNSILVFDTILSDFSYITYFGRSLSDFPFILSNVYFLFLTSLSTY